MKKRKTIFTRFSDTIKVECFDFLETGNENVVEIRANNAGMGIRDITELIDALKSARDWLEFNEKSNE